MLVAKVSRISPSTERDNTLYVLQLLEVIPLLVLVNNDWLERRAVDV
jgi:hypothetical protein